MKTRALSRRTFIAKSALTAATVSVVPRHVLGGTGYIAPSDKLNIGSVGVGGKGRTDVEGVISENVIALCDVDEERASANRRGRKNALELAPKARFYTDFREMLDKEKDLDAVTVSTPDHTHATIALEAMKRGLHVFVQKPLTKTVQEARILQKAAKKYNVVTQMGNQGHSREGIRLMKEWVDAGLIGDIKEIHCWTNRPVWPQGIGRPEEEHQIPETLDWDLWLGPAPYRSYHPAYAPFKWRGWLDFGVGAIGDMGAHIVDIPYWIFDLGYPETIEASSTKLNKETYPHASIIKYNFAKSGNRPTVPMTWWDGGMQPPRPEGLEQGRIIGNKSGGNLLVGDRGTIMCGCYGDDPEIIQKNLMEEATVVEKTIPRSPGIYQEWIDAIKAGKKSSTDFSYAAPLTETMLLGNIAVLTKEQNKILQYDAKKMKFSNCDQANDLLHYKYRDGWKLEI